MTSRRALAALTVTASAAAAALAAAPPASAGGIGDFLSPAFGTDCANQGGQPHAVGATTAGTGTANSNLLGLPIGSPLNQCGGADAPSIADIQNNLNAATQGSSGFGDLSTALKIQGAS